ncbi:MAG: SapC family protein [Pseudomonadota bacterium]
MKQRMRAVLCRDIPELNAWRDQSYLKEALLQETGGGEAFIARATQTLYQALLSLRIDPLAEPGQLSCLLDKGYAKQQIARAFAEAWLADDETFYLPSFRFVDSGWVIHGVPITAAAATVTLLIFFGSHQYPQIASTFIWLTSFLAIPAYLLFLAYSWLWRGAMSFFTSEANTLNENPPPGHPVVHLATLAGPDLPQPSLPTTTLTVSARPADTAVSPSSSSLGHRNHPMYQALEAFDLQLHADLLFSPASNYAFAAALTTVALGAEELPAAVMHYPVVFPTQGSVVPTAVLGLAGRNRFLDDQARWLVADVPAVVRYYPFTLVDVPGVEPGQMVVALDRAAQHFARGTGEPLVKADGTPSDLVLRIQDLLVAHRRHMQATQTVLADLDAHGVLLERQLTVQTSTAPRMIDGFRTVDLEQVNAQDDATLARWVRNGTLQVVYLHLASLRHFGKLVEVGGAAGASQNSQ